MRSPRTGVADGCEQPCASAPVQEKQKLLTPESSLQPCFWLFVRRSHFMAQTDLELIMCRPGHFKPSVHPPASASGELGLQACATMLGMLLCF